MAGPENAFDNFVCNTITSSFPTQCVQLTAYITDDILNSADEEMTFIHFTDKYNIPDSKIHGANVGPTWGRQDPGGPHVGPMNHAIWDVHHKLNSMG